MKSMKSNVKSNATLIALMAIAGLTATSAKADGFVCNTVENDLTVRVYNYTAPEMGTRNSAVMIVSDPAIQHGRKTIATFTEIEGTLDSQGSFYEGRVDLRFKNLRRKGELISGTKLGQLKSISLDVFHSYDEPVEAGTMLSGTLVLEKRNGETLERNVECARYLKSAK